MKQVLLLMDALGRIFVSENELLLRALAEYDMRMCERIGTRGGSVALARINDAHSDVISQMPRSAAARVVSFTNGIGGVERLYWYIYPPHRGFPKRTIAEACGKIVEWSRIVEVGFADATINDVLVAIYEIALGLPYHVLGSGKNGVVIAEENGGVSVRMQGSPAECGEDDECIE